MNDHYSSLGAYASSPDDYSAPHATVSLAETTLLTPTSPDSFQYMQNESHEDRRTTKKRKSWGQELPTPKTNLPPRKRAKTEDEKEQRRIERVLRNRQAAQSSRERKRQEVEKLEGEKHLIEQQNQLLKERIMATEHEKFTMAQEIAKLSHQVQTLRSRVTSGAPSKAPTPSCGPSPTLTADLLQHRKDIKKELDDLPFSLAISQGTLDPRESFSSASSSASSRSSSPCRTSVDRAATFPDLTQHPAAVLCDLPSATIFSATDAPSLATFNSSPMSDSSFNRLFDTPTTPQPAVHFFEDGLGPEANDNDANAFSFDSLVDLDAGQSTQIDTSFLKFDHQDHFDMLSASAQTAFDFPHQSAATSSSLQPCLGASS
ncbi:hypothetical protein MMC20_004908 [Loxospora ochrophaea]|nr:hypothetical protein [Loxospora ochrophaea]